MRSWNDTLTLTARTHYPKHLYFTLSLPNPSLFKLGDCLSTPTSSNPLPPTPLFGHPPIAFTHGPSILIFNLGPMGASMTNVSQVVHGVTTFPWVWGGIKYGVRWIPPPPRILPTFYAPCQDDYEIVGTLQGMYDFFELYS